jgi:hypothetical protein
MKRPWPEGAIRIIMWIVLVILVVLLLLGYLYLGRGGDLLVSLQALGLIAIDWMSRIASLTPLGQLRVPRG